MHSRSIPRSVLIHITSFLEDPQHILDMGLVCQHWHDATNDPSVWEGMVLSSLETLSVASSSSASQSGPSMSPHRPHPPSLPSSPSSSVDNLSMGTFDNDDHNPNDEVSTDSSSVSRLSAIHTAVRQARPVAESTLSGHRKTVGCVALDRRGDKSGPGYAVSGAADGTVCLWRLADNQPVQVWRQAHRARVGSVYVDATRAVVLSGAHDGSVMVHRWNPDPTNNNYNNNKEDILSGQLSLRLEGHRSRVRVVTMVGDAVVPGTDQGEDTIPNPLGWGISAAILTGSADHTLRIWSLDTGDEIAAVTTPGPVCSVAVHPRGCSDGRDMIAVGTEDGTISLWSPSYSYASSSPSITLSLLQTLFGHAAPVTALSFLPRSDSSSSSSASASSKPAKLLSGSVDHSVRLWNTSAARCLRTFRGHTGTVAAIIPPLRPRSPYFITAGHDRRLRIFNIRTARASASLRTPAAIRSAAAYPDLATLIATGDGPRIRRWDFDPTVTAPSRAPSLASLAVSRSGPGPGHNNNNNNNNNSFTNNDNSNDEIDDTSSISSYTSIGSVNSLSSIATAPDPRSSSSGNPHRYHRHRHRHRVRPSIAATDNRLPDLSPGHGLYERGQRWESLRSGAVRDLAADLHAADQRRRHKKATPYEFTTPRDGDFITNVERDEELRKERQEALRERLERFRNPGHVSITRKAARLHREGSVFDRLYSDAKRKDKRR